MMHKLNLLTGAAIGALLALIAAAYITGACTFDEAIAALCAALLAAVGLFILAKGGQ